ncbi:MAG: hypothetical protein IJR53_04340 [Bacteroidales bacterium]|jgi:hypothetical protein|nr:hypothetical protein [Bacteroidales bacterium]
MGKIFQLRTKQKINSKIGAGFTFNVPSVWSTGHPSDPEIKKALEDQFGKDAGNFSAWGSQKYEILS